MESLIIAALFSMSVVITLLFWILLVRPHVIVQALFNRDHDSPHGSEEGFGWPEPDPSTLRAARWSMGVLMVFGAFLCGAATTFLLAT